MYRMNLMPENLKLIKKKEKIQTGILEKYQN
jgi:hypothetical protein